MAQSKPNDAECTFDEEQLRGRVRLVDHTIDLLQTIQVRDEASRWFGGFWDPLRLAAEPWYAAGAVDLMVGALLEPRSRHYGSAAIGASATLAMEYVRRNQYPNGTIDAYFVGDMQAACNAAFAARMLARVYRKLKARPTPVLDESFLAQIETFLKMAGRAMIERSAYTSNHRWVIADALLQIHELFPDPALARRAFEYLSQGIDINEDGLYSELSSNYGRLTNETLLSIGERTGNEQYFEYVKRNLEFVLHLIQPNGEDVYQFSRRQDAVLPGTRIDGVDVFRTMAVRTGDGRFAAMADLLAQEFVGAALEERIEREAAGWRTEIDDGDVRFPSLKYSIVGRLSRRGELLDTAAYLDTGHIAREPLPTSFHRYYSASRLVRARHDDFAVTVMGMQPNFLTVYAGGIVLEGLQLKYLYHNWRVFHPVSFTRENGAYILRGSHLSNPELTGKRKERMQREDQDLAIFVQLREITRRSWEVRFEIEGQRMVPIQLELAVRPQGVVRLRGREYTLPSSSHLFASESIVLSSGKSRLRIDGLSEREHRFIDDRGGWLGNIPFSSIYATYFSPCSFVMRITAE